MTLTTREPADLSFASVVTSRQRSSRASARYSASYVLAQPIRSAIRRASSAKPFGLRGLTSAWLSRSNAIVASSAEISFRNLNSWSTEVASDHMRYGATSCSLTRGSRPASERHAVTTTAASTTNTQRPVREERIAATTSGMASRVAVRRQPAGRAKTDFASVSSARSPSSIMCWVPIRVALSRPERIQRRTVSGSRFVRRAASGTVSNVAAYYNNCASTVQQRRWQTVLIGGTRRHSANSEWYF